MGRREGQPEEGALELTCGWEGASRAGTWGKRGREAGPRVTCLDGAAHEGRPVDGLPKHPQQVLRGLLEVHVQGHAPCEVLEALHRVAPRQCFIGPAQPVGAERAL